MRVSVLRLHVRVDVCRRRVQSVDLVWLAVRESNVAQVRLSRHDVATRRNQVVAGPCCHQVAPLHVAEVEGITMYNLLLWWWWW